MKTYHWEADSDLAVFHLPYETGSVCFRIAHVPLQSLSRPSRAAGHLLKCSVFQLAVCFGGSFTAFCPVGWLHAVGPGIPSSKYLKKRLQMFSVVSPRDSARCNCTADVTRALQHGKRQRIPSGWVWEKVSLWWDVVQLSRPSISWGLACMNKYTSGERMLGVTGQSFALWLQSLCYNAEWKELEYLVRDSEDVHRWQFSMEQCVWSSNSQSCLH